MESMEDSLLEDLSLINEPEIEDYYHRDQDDELDDFDWINPPCVDPFSFQASGQVFTFHSYYHEELNILVTREKQESFYINKMLIKYISIFNRAQVWLAASCQQQPLQWLPFGKQQPA